MELATEHNIQTSSDYPSTTIIGFTNSSKQQH